MSRPDYKGQLSEIAGHLDCDAIDAGAILFTVREIQADLEKARDEVSELIAERNGIVEISQQQAAESLIAASTLRAENAKLREALTSTKTWLRKLQPAMNVMCSECLDDIIKDQIDAALTETTETGR